MEPDVTKAPVPNHGGARWCPEHVRLECTRDRRHGAGTCHAPAVRGTNTCRIHSGRKTATLIAQGKAKIASGKRIDAWNARNSVPDLDYRIAVLGVLQMTWIRMSTYSELLRRQAAAEGLEADTSTDGDDVQASGLIGHRYGAAGKDGMIYAQSEEVRALVTLEAAERDRVMKYAKIAHDMGISDRLTSMAERWGDMVAGRISDMLDALNLTPEQSIRVPELVSIYLGKIDVGSIDVSSSYGPGGKS